ncbi:MAG: hypothetical protein AAGI45_15030 [Cyanobacteria bacterium P01_H01_bin.26]
MRIIQLSLIALGMLFAYVPLAPASAEHEYSIIGPSSSEATSDTYLAQAAPGQVLSALSEHIQNNQGYFNDYALGQANRIGESASWRSAALQFDPNVGGILLDLSGNVILPPEAAAWFGSPPIRLALLFTPDSCFRYSYTDYGLRGGGLLHSEISAEVAAALNAVRSDMEASLNQEVTQSFSNIGLSPQCR